MKATTMNQVLDHILSISCSFQLAIASSPFQPVAKGIHNQSLALYEWDLNIKVDKYRIRNHKQSFGQVYLSNPENSEVEEAVCLLSVLIQRHPCQGQYLLHHQNSGLITVLFLQHKHALVVLSLVIYELSHVTSSVTSSLSTFSNILFSFHFYQSFMIILPSTFSLSSFFISLLPALQTTLPLTLFLSSFFLHSPLVLVFNNSSYALLPSPLRGTAPTVTGQDH